VPALPRTGFAPGRVTILPERPSDFAYLALGDLWLEIPRLEVKVNIVGVPFKGEDWTLTWLGSQAGYLEGTAYPTHAGNTGITAHAYLADGSPGPFVDLNQLRYGDQIVIHMGGQRYIYEVRESKLVQPNDLSVLKHEKYPWLTLVTCKAYNESAGAYQFRVSVRAVLVKVESE
jgi:LPXTG-site transpeptidase (sortase) family protein